MHLENKKLSATEIESLFTFCKKHYVHYYDVQVELVDHLAESIEHLMLAEPKINFTTALEKVHASFGIMGFAPVVAARERQMQKIQSKEKRALYFSYFKLPKLLLTLCLLSIVFFVSKWFSRDVLFYFTYINLLWITMFEWRILYKASRLFKQSIKTLLLLSNNSSLVFSSLLIFNAFHFMKFENPSTNQFLFINCSAILIFVNILSYKVYAEKLYHKAKKEYPLAFV